MRLDQEQDLLRWLRDFDVQIAWNTMARQLLTPGTLEAASKSLLFNTSPCFFLLTLKSHKTKLSHTESATEMHIHCEPDYALPQHTEIQPADSQRAQTDRQ